MTKTEIYELGLWEGTDYPNYAMPNNNMLKIESALKTISTNVESLKETTDIVRNKTNTLETNLTNEETERTTTDNELNSRITENAEDIEHLDDEITKNTRNIGELYVFTTNNQTAVTSLSSEISSIRNKINSIKNSELKMYINDATYPASSSDLRPIDNGLGLPDWYNESTKEFDAGTYVLTINAYIDTIYASGGRDITYYPTSNTTPIAFRFNSAGGENPYPMAFSAIATLNNKGSFNLPGLGYTGSTVVHYRDIVMTVTKIS